jgi:ribosomal protein S18 acetylase RimI-like enzyme
MPRLSEPATIRALLETDRAWAAYALADLTPGFFEHCQWHGCQQPSPAIILLYRAFETPVLVTVGAAPSVANLLEEIRDEPEMYLSIRPDILPLIKARYDVLVEAPMWRMVLDPAAFGQAPDAPAPCEAVPLTLADLPALQQLYADGDATGEAPDFFSPNMVEQGIFFGVREGPALVASAGTHVYSLAESVGTVGNVYTRRDRRGRGLAGQVTRCVTAELLRLGLQTIVLNVSQSNPAAIRVYMRLGFRRHTGFFEGQAKRRA